MSDPSEHRWPTFHPFSLCRVWFSSFVRHDAGRNELKEQDGGPEVRSAPCFLQPGFNPLCCEIKAGIILSDCFLSAGGSAAPVGLHYRLSPTQPDGGLHHHDSCYCFLVVSLTAVSRCRQESSVSVGRI